MKISQNMTSHAFSFCLDGRLLLIPGQVVLDFANLQMTSWKVLGTHSDPPDTDF